VGSQLFGHTQNPETEIRIPNRIVAQLLSVVDEKAIILSLHSTETRRYLPLLLIILKPRDE